MRQFIGSIVGSIVGSIEGLSKVYRGSIEGLSSNTENVDAGCQCIRKAARRRRPLNTYPSAHDLVKTNASRLSIPVRNGGNNVNANHAAEAADVLD